MFGSKVEAPYKQVLENLFDKIVNRVILPIISPKTLLYLPL